MQTELTWADLTGVGAVKEDEVRREPDAELDGRLAHVLSGKPGDDSPYGEVRVWVDAKTFVPLRIDYADRQGRPLKRFRALRLGAFEGRSHAQKAIVENLQTGKSTQIEVTRLARSNLGDEAFTERALERG